jgi:di/tripeptidase
MTAQSAAITQIAVAAIRANGMTPQLSASSTDANLPMSLGVPALTIGSGGSGGRAHALDEWIDVEKGQSVKGMSTGLLMLLTMADMP